MNVLQKLAWSLGVCTVIGFLGAGIVHPITISGGTFVDTWIGLTIYSLVPYAAGVVTHKKLNL